MHVATNLSFVSSTDSEHAYLHKSLLIFIGIYLFYWVERIISFITDSSYQLFKSFQFVSDAYDLPSKSVVQSQSKLTSCRVNTKWMEKEKQSSLVSDSSTDIISNTTKSTQFNTCHEETSSSRCTLDVSTIDQVK